MLKILLILATAVFVLFAAATWARVVTAYLLTVFDWLLYILLEIISMIASIQNDIASLIFRVNIITREQQEAMERENQQRMAAAKANHGDD